MFTNFRPQLYKFLIFHITTSHRQIPINILTIYNAKNVFYTKVYSATYIAHVHQITTFVKPKNYHQAIKRSTQQDNNKPPKKNPKENFKVDKRKLTNQHPYRFQNFQRGSVEFTKPTKGEGAQRITSVRGRSII